MYHGSLFGLKMGRPVKNIRFLIYVQLNQINKTSYDCYVLGSTYGHTVPHMFFAVIEFGGILEPPKGPQNCPEEGE